MIKRINTWAKSRDDLITAAKRRRTIAAGARHELVKALVPVLKRQVTQAATHVETSGNLPSAFREQWEMQLIQAKQSLGAQFAREGYRLGELDVSRKVSAKEFFGKAVYADDLIDRRLRMRLDAYLAKTSRLETDTTIAKLTELYNDGIAEGLTTTEIAHTFLDEGASVLAGLDRADLMARCMTSWSYNNGSMEAYKDAGYRTELLASDDACEICLPMNGKIADSEGLFDGEEFPFHPHDRCTVIPVTTDESDEEEGKSGGNPNHDEKGRFATGTTEKSEDLPGEFGWKDAEAFRKKHLNDPLKTGDENQERALLNYIGNEYSYINSVMRGDDRSMKFVKASRNSNDIQNLRKEASYIQSTMKPLDTSVEAYRFTKNIRGVDYSNLVGKEFTEKGFTSCALSKDSLFFSTHPVGTRMSSINENSVFFAISVPKGTPVIAGKKAELEMIMGAGQRFRVASAVKVRGDWGASAPRYWAVNLEMVK